MKDWAGTVSASQPAIKNSSKAIIAILEVPTWSNDPSNQLNDLISRLPAEAADKVRELATLAREMAPEATYTRKTTPQMRSRREAKAITEKVFYALHVEL